MPTIHDARVRVVGGVSYFEFVVDLDGATRLTALPAHLGTNLIQRFHAERRADQGSDSTNLTPRPGATALGALAPGGYLLWVEGWSPTLGDYALQLALPFEVPPGTGPTLQALAPQREAFRVLVHGIPNILYSIERSTNLVDWEAVTDHLGAPFILSDSWEAAAGRCFYRAAIVSPLERPGLVVAALAAEDGAILTDESGAWIEPQ